MESFFMTRDQALSLWSGSTNSKTLDYQRTNTATATAAKSIQSCPTLSNPMDCSLPSFSIMGFPRQEYWSAVPLPSPENKHYRVLNSENSHK